MTRRGFFHGVAGVASAILLGAAWLLKKAVPRRFTRARRLPAYPGPVRPLGDVSKPAKWSG